MCVCVILNVDQHFVLFGWSICYIIVSYFFIFYKIFLFFFYCLLFHLLCHSHYFMNNFVHIRALLLHNKRISIILSISSVQYVYNSTVAVTTFPICIKTRSHRANKKISSLRIENWIATHSKNANVWN